MKVSLGGKVAIITGGAGGIGRVCAKLMLENTAVVILADINKEEGERVKKELSSLGKCEFIKTDVSKKESVSHLVDTVLNKFKTIDILVNNAAITIGINRVNINEFSFEDWQRSIEVDLNGVFYCSKIVSQVMVKQKGGRIINIGSVLGTVPARKQIAYVAAKAGVHNLTKAMALELAPFGINVNAVAPGSTLTPATERLFYGKDATQAKMVKRMLSHIPLGKPGEPEDVANAVLFLCGKESKYITGHVLVVDGGWTCGYSRDF